MKVVVLGSGRMGAQIGCEYHLGGHDVTFVARDSALVIERVQDCLTLAGRLGMRPKGDDRSDIVVATPGQIEQQACDLVIESLPEELDLKVRLLRPVVRRFRKAVIASNTSSLSITATGDEIGAAERPIGTHYWNPPLLMPLVEVVVTPRTRRDVADFVLNTLTALGKHPVLLEGDAPGFVWNRLQSAVIREAVWLAEQGIASPDTIDLIVRKGLARRWRHLGPFASAALGGVETWRRIGANILPDLSTARDLQGLERWLTNDLAQLEHLRTHRDQALLAELIRERSTDSQTRLDGSQDH